MPNRHLDPPAVTSPKSRRPLILVGACALVVLLARGPISSAQESRAKLERRLVRPPALVQTLRDRAHLYGSLAGIGVDPDTFLPRGAATMARRWGQSAKRRYEAAVTSALAFKAAKNGKKQSRPVGVRQAFHDGDSDVGPPDNQTPLNPLFDATGFLGDETGESFPVGPGHRIAFYDFDGDGDIDVFIGDKYDLDPDVDLTHIRYFENIGSPTAPQFAERFDTANPFNDFNQVDFSIVDEPDVAVAQTAPFLVNWDVDAQPEAFIGLSDGRVLFWQYNAGTGQFEDDTVNSPIKMVLPAGIEYAVPHVVDFDDDNDLDVFIGTARDGIIFLHNQGANVFSNETGDDEMVIDAVVDPFAHVGPFKFDGSEGAFLTPFFADIDGDGDLDAFVGDSLKAKDDMGVLQPAYSFGVIRYFESDLANGGDPFLTEHSEIGGNPLQGNAFHLPAPYLVDIDGDGDLDAFIGGKVLSISYMQNTGSATTPAFLSTMNGIEFVDFDGDGDLDAFAGPGKLGGVVYFENTGSPTQPQWEARRGPGSDPFYSLNAEIGCDLGFVRPAVGNVDGDGNMEAFVGFGYSIVAPVARTAPPAGEAEGVVGHREALTVGPDENLLCFFEHNGTEFVQVATPILGFPTVGDPACTEFEGPADPHLADFDGDGDLDLVVGTTVEVPDEPPAGQTVTEGRIFFFRNDNGADTFTLVDTFGDDPNEVLIAKLVGISPHLADIDGDGDLDLFVGSKYAEPPYGGPALFFLNQSGSPNSWAFDFENPEIIEAATTFFATPALVDINGDGTLDLFLGGKLAVDAFESVQAARFDVEVPTLGQWGLGALGSLLALFGWSLARRRD